MAKLEKAEARHQEELRALRSMVEKAKAEAKQAKEDSEKAKKAAGSETDDTSGEPVETTDQISMVPALTASQLLAVEEASSREREYISQLETARDALNKMREKLSEAHERQNEEANALKFFRRMQRKHQQELEELLVNHRSQMLQLVAASSSKEAGENPEALGSDLDTDPNSAEHRSRHLVHSAMSADLERHEEASRQQLHVMQERLETERIHREQLKDMEDRHRRELKAAAIGTTARAMTVAITDSAALSTRKKKATRLRGR